MNSEVYRRTDETAETSAQGGTSADKDPAGVSNPESTTPDEESKIESLKVELQQCQDRFLRKAAEFDNYRKRMEKEKSEASQLAKSSILMEFLPIADACERAIESLAGPQNASEGLEHYREGVRLLYKQIHDVLGRIGVVPVVAQGQKFDPHFHEAVAREEDPEHEENTVVVELRRGYLFKGRLLRPAQVKVAIRPQPKVASEQ